MEYQDLITTIASSKWIFLDFLVFNDHLILLHDYRSL